jgi:REP element-mobilizing transposase RayT
LKEGRRKIGKMVKKWWQELELKFKDIRLDQYVIMPNHFHGIILIVGVDLGVNPKNHWANT